METIIIRRYAHHPILSWKQVIWLLLAAIAIGSLLSLAELQIGEPIYSWYSRGLTTHILILITIFMYEPVRDYVRSAWNFRALTDWNNYGLLAGAFVIQVLLYNLLNGISFAEALTLLMNPTYSHPADAALWQKAIYLLTAGLLIPVQEETIIRGILFQKISQLKGVLWGIMFSALIFTFVHRAIDIPYIVHLFTGGQSALVHLSSLVLLFISGVFLASLYYYTRSLAVCILYHGCWNIFITFYSLYF